MPSRRRVRMRVLQEGVSICAIQVTTTKRGIRSPRITMRKRISKRKNAPSSNGSMPFGPSFISAHRFVAMSRPTFATRGNTAALRSSNTYRPILRDFDETRPIDAFPKMLSPIKGAEKLAGKGDGDGRNGALFRHSALLLRNGFTPTEVKTVLYLINQYIFSEPLPDEEMKKLTRREALENFDTGRTTAEEDFGSPLRPKSQNDIGMAELFVREYKSEVRYSEATGWLVWNGRQSGSNTS